MAETLAAIAVASMPPLGGFACLFGLQAWSDKHEQGVKPFDNAMKSMENIKISDSVRKMLGTIGTKLKTFKN